MAPGDSSVSGELDSPRFVARPARNLPAGAQCRPALHFRHLPRHFLRDVNPTPCFAPAAMSRHTLSPVKPGRVLVFVGAEQFPPVDPQQRPHQHGIGPLPHTRIFSAHGARDNAPARQSRRLLNGIPAENPLLDFVVQQRAVNEKPDGRPRHPNESASSAQRPRAPRVRAQASLRILRPRWREGRWWECRRPRRCRCYRARGSG